jgi:hypothetical protein
MRRALILLAAAAAVAAGAGTATADIPPPVYVSSTGGCNSGYIEVVQAGNSAVCVIRYTPPSFRVTTTGCGYGETPYLVLNRYGVCTS